MTINKEVNGSKLSISLVGRLDSATSAELNAELNASLDEIQELVFDFAQVDYISSAGLRVLLAVQKTMKNKGSMTICNVNETVMEIFEMTAFVKILNIV